MAFDVYGLLGGEPMMDENKKLFVKDSPFWKNLADTQIPWDSEIVESFTKGGLIKFTFID